MCCCATAAPGTAIAAIAAIKRYFLIVILLDWSQPWLWLRQLRSWIRVLRSLVSSLDDESKVRFIVDSSIKQAITTQSPVAFILSPLLTGGNPASHSNLSA